jgi:hypothetical protein
MERWATKPSSAFSRVIDLISWLSDNIFFDQIGKDDVCSNGILYCVPSPKSCRKGDGGVYDFLITQYRFNRVMCFAKRVME